MRRLLPCSSTARWRVNWEYMDTALMQRFWANHEEERASKADISDRVLVFHRGISTVRFCGV